MADSPLSKKRCIPCEAGIPPLVPEEVRRLLAKLAPGWGLVEAKKLRKTFKFSDFKSAMSFANTIAQIAETQGHHPDIIISWGKAVVELTTHAIGGLSENDFILAAKIDEVLH